MSTFSITRGDVVICVAPGDCGKPRPAAVVQSDLLTPTHSSVVVCPMSSDFIEVPGFRGAIDPTEENGLRLRSQVMIDKVQALSRERLKKRAGALSAADMANVVIALRLVLGLRAIR